MSKGFGESDFAQVLGDRANSEPIKRVLEQDREQTERAYERLAKGAYGVCEDCGEKIAAMRLEALPDSTRCVKCQVEWERGNRL